MVAPHRVAGEVGPVVHMGTTAHTGVANKSADSRTAFPSICMGRLLARGWRGRFLGAPDCVLHDPYRRVLTNQSVDE